MPKHERVMTLRDEPLVIITIHGPIEIHRHQGSRSDRKLRIILPDGLRCAVGLDRALAHNAWLDIADGNVAPRNAAYEASPDNAGGVKLTPKKDQPTPRENRPVVRIVRRPLLNSIAEPSVAI